MKGSDMPLYHVQQHTRVTRIPDPEPDPPNWAMGLFWFVVVCLAIGACH
jgi:hypothetical protein